MPSAPCLSVSDVIKFVIHRGGLRGGQLLQVAKGGDSPTCNHLTRSHININKAQVQGIKTLMKTGVKIQFTKYEPVVGYCM